MTMEYFLESRNLDKVTEDMLRNYNKDGNGAFSKDEVVSIIIDLRQEHVHNDNLSSTNKLYKHLLVTAIALSVFLLAGMFALSYTVAALTAKTEIQSDGTMVAMGTNTAVATDSRAAIHILPMNENGAYCTTWDEVDSMRLEITLGRNVVLDQTDLDGGEQVTKLSGGSVTITHDETCFTTSTGEVKCAVAWPECEGLGVGRTLSADERLRLGLSEHRRLSSHNSGSCIGCLVVGGVSGATVNACIDATTSELVPQPDSYFNRTGCGCVDGDCVNGGDCVADTNDVCSR
jgi:hypothetical protein